MEFELVCPRGHRIPDESEGSLSLSPLGDERLNISIDCYKCGLRWEMSVRLFTCDEKRLGGGSLILRSLRR
jgi:hypothetical protein